MKWLGFPLPGRCLSYLCVAWPLENENSLDQQKAMSGNSLGVRARLLEQSLSAALLSAAVQSGLERGAGNELDAL